MSFDLGFFAGACPPVSVHVGCLVKSAPACVIVTTKFPTWSACERRQTEGHLMPLGGLEPSRNL